MEERDQIFRERLIAVTQDLHKGSGKDPKLKGMIGAYASRMIREAGVRDWADLKARADGRTYDSMLKIFSEQSAAAARAGDDASVRAFEVLALSTIARRQYQADLVPGVTFIDNFINSCCAFARRKGISMLSTKPAGS